MHSINEIFECLWCKIVTPNTQFYVSAIYMRRVISCILCQKIVRKFNPLIQMQKLLFLVTLMV